MSKPILTSLSSSRAAVLLLLEGYVSVALQMIALRQIVPFVGSSINVTSIVITGFLAALALGYQSGGRITSDLHARLQKNFMFAALWSGIALSYVAAHLFFKTITHPLPSLLAVALYTLVFVMPVVFALSQTVVMLINVYRGDNSSEQAGNVFNVSTWGNVAGGLITTLVVMFYLGIGASVWVMVLLLCIAFCLVPNSPQHPVSRGAKIVFVVFTLLCAAALNVAYEQARFYKTNAHANYTIYRGDDISYLEINLGNASRHDSTGLGHAYAEYIEDQLLTKPDVASNVLVLGAGGFSIGQGRDLSNVNITFVDIDGAQRAIGSTFLNVPEDTLNLVAMDARAFLIEHDTRFDAIVFDVFGTHKSIPTHLYTKEFFELLKSRLADNGVMYMNTIMPKHKVSRFARGLSNTVRAVFAECDKQDIVPLNGASAVNKNVVFTCRSHATDDYHVVYTDKNTRAAVDMIAR